MSNWNPLNFKPAQLRKAVVAGVVTALGVLGVALTDGHISAAEIGGIIAGFGAGFGTVFGVKNAK